MKGKPKSVTRLRTRASLTTDYFLTAIKGDDGEYKMGYRCWLCDAIETDVLNMAAHDRICRACFFGESSDGL